MKFNNENQVKSYMKKESSNLGITVPRIYSTYFSRELLKRISLFNFGEIVVKGSFSQYVHLQRLIRPVTDVDLASKLCFGDAMIPLINSINAYDDEIKFVINKEPYRKPSTGMYKITVEAHLGNIVQPIGIDFHEHIKSLYETQYKPVVPIFKNDDIFYTNTPSFEEHLAEKLCIVCESNKPDVINTRLKDFYDIYEMHGGKYDPDKFSLYFARMLNDRGKIDTDTASTAHLSKEFVNSHQDTWDAMREKYEFLDKDIEFCEAVYYTRAVLSEQLQKMKTKTVYYGPSLSLKKEYK